MGLSFEHNAFACLGSLPIVGFEVWVVAQADHVISGGGGADWFQIGVTIGVNVVVIVIMVILLVSAKKKYDDVVAKDAQLIEPEKKSASRSGSFHSPESPTGSGCFSP